MTSLSNVQKAIKQFNKAASQLVKSKHYKNLNKSIENLKALSNEHPRD